MLCGALFSRVGLAWVLPKRVVDLFTCWKGPSKPNCVEDGIFLCFVVSLEERNDRSLDDSERMVAKLKSFFFKTLYHWTAALIFNVLSSFHDFLDLFSLSSSVFLLYTLRVVELISH